MEKNVREIMREALVELGKIAVEAYDKGVNFEFGTRESEAEQPWITGTISLEGWNEVKNGENENAYHGFQIYPFHVDSIKDVLDSIRFSVNEMARYEVKQVKVVTLKK